MTTGRLLETLRKYYKEHFVERVGKYYKEIGHFETDEEMEIFMDWYFISKGVLFSEIVLYIAEKSFSCHNATLQRVIKAGGDSFAKDEGGNCDNVKGSNSEGGGMDEKFRVGDETGKVGSSSNERSKGEFWGESGGHRFFAFPHPILLDINPIKISTNEDPSQQDDNSTELPLNFRDFPQEDTDPDRLALDQESPGGNRLQTDKFRELLQQSTCRYSRAVATQLSDQWQHNLDLWDSRPAGLLYHGTTESAIPSLRITGVEPPYIRNYLSTSAAFYVGNLLPECILSVLLKKPQLEDIQDPMAVLSLKMERTLLEDIPERRDWVVFDLSGYEHDLKALQDVSILP